MLEKPAKRPPALDPQAKVLTAARMTTSSTTTSTATAARAFGCRARSGSWRPCDDGRSGTRTRGRRGALPEADPAAGAARILDDELLHLDVGARGQPFGDAQVQRADDVALGQRGRAEGAAAEHDVGPAAPPSHLRLEALPLQRGGDVVDRIVARRHPERGAGPPADLDGGVAGT